MIIETERLILRTIVAEDAEDIFEYSKEAEVGPNAGWKPHSDIEETRMIMNAIFIGQEGVFGIIPKDIGRVVGTVGLINDPKREYTKARMLGYAMSKRFWGMGYMTEAALAVIKYGFDDLELEAISAYCYPYNERSRRVILKCGMEYEGTLKKCEVLYDGTVLDNECYLLGRK